MPSSTFPFAAILGQSDAKTALQLLYLDPKLGGLIISGNKGNGKSTLVRGFGSLIQTLADTPKPLVNVPLGTSEEKLIGSLDLEKLVDNKSVAFAPGLINKAHGGMMYVDEVNLLPDHLVDQLLDVAESGVHRVERDHISHESTAEFVLVGSMNPDEGEIREQLLDRFGLWVNVHELESAELRCDVIERRLSFDQDPISFTSTYSTQTQALADALKQAQQRLPRISIEAHLKRTISEKCLQAGVKGLRADLFLRRAATAYAALLGDDEVTEKHVDRVAPWVLQHRSTQPSPKPESGQDPRSDPNQKSQESQPQDNPRHASDPQEKQGDWGKMNQVMDLPERFDRSYDAEGLLLAESKSDSVKKKAVAERSHSPSKLKSKGDQISPRLGDKQDKSMLDVVGTLTHPKNIDSIRLNHLAQTGLRKRLGQHYVVVLDTSGSNLRKQTLNKTLSLLDRVSERAYQTRSGLSLITFSGAGACEEKDFTRAPKWINKAVRQLPMGGGTPIREALTLSREHVAQKSKRDAALEYQVLLITDGRTHADLCDLQFDSPITVIDVDDSTVKLGGAERLAKQLRAQYCLADQFETHRL